MRSLTAMQIKVLHSNKKKTNQQASKQKKKQLQDCIIDETIIIEFWLAKSCQLAWLLTRQRK